MGRKYTTTRKFSRYDVSTKARKAGTTSLALGFEAGSRNGNRFYMSLHARGVKAARVFRSTSVFVEDEGGKRYDGSTGRGTREGEAEGAG